MKKVRLLLASLLALSQLALGASAFAAEVAPGSLVKSASSPAVYYIDEDLSRHVFPNGRIFQTWFEDFDGVITLTDAELAQYPLVGNMPYKPGRIMVKIQTDPRTYAVDEGGVLRWIKSEAAARALYGNDWNRKIHDLSDAFFTDYQTGEDVDEEDDFDADQGDRRSDIAKTLRLKRLKRLAAKGASDDALENGGFGKDKVAVCHKFAGNNPHTIFIAKPALPAHLAHGDKEGRCAGDGQGDTAAPTFVSLTTGSITVNSAHVLLTASEPVMAKVYLSTSATVDTSASASPAASAGGLSATHDMTLSGLASGTTYNYRVVIKDAAGNSATSSTQSFTTLAVDTTAPTILTSSATSITATGASIIFTANEPVTAKVYVSTSSTVDTSASATPAATLSTLSASHTAALTGLSASTTYYVAIVAKDAALNQVISAIFSFLTL